MLAIVAKFFYKDVVYKHKVLDVIINNSRPKNKEFLVALAKTYKINQIVAFAYYLLANRITKRRHKLIVNTLLKLTLGGVNN
jgi:hypothetical protein